MKFSYDVHVLLAKSEKLVGSRRWLSSYDKSILRTLEVVDVFFTRRNYIYLKAIYLSIYVSIYVCMYVCMYLSIYLSIY